MNLEFDSISLKLLYDGPKELRGANLIYVCISLSDIKDRFFILTKKDLQHVIIGRFIPWLEGHNWQRPRKPDSFHCDYNLASLLPYEDNWKLISERFGQLELSDSHQI